MPNVIGKVIRLCLSLKVIPVFTTPYEQGFQGKIERFNGEIQEKFWQRRTFRNIKDVEKHLPDYVQAHRLLIKRKSYLPLVAVRFQNDGNERMLSYLVV